MDGAEGATCNDGFDDELGGVDLPVLPVALGNGEGHGRSGGGGIGGGEVDAVAVGFWVSHDLVLLQSQDPVEVPLQLLIQALQINLICPHKPITTLLHLSKFRLSKTQN